MTTRSVLKLRLRVGVLVGALGLAACSTAMAQVPTNIYSYSRSSGFTYKPNGLLETETIEPGNADSCVTTTYSYDAYGNKTSALTQNCTGASSAATFASRTSGSTYAAQTVMVGATSVSIPAGAFATTATNALNQSESRTYDPRFGSVATLTGPNGLTTRVDVDDFGRPIKETRADGTSTVTRYCIIPNRFLDTSSNSSGCGSTALSGNSAEILSYAVSYVETQSLDTAGNAMGPLARAYKDRAGRTIREIAESFDGGSQPTGARRYVAKDVSYDLYGVATLTYQPYFFGAGSSTVAGSGDVGITRTKVDALGRTVQVDVMDAQGTVPEYNPNGTVARMMARTTIDYSGLVTTTTDPKGQTRKEERNVEGKVVRVTDAYGGQLAYQHDAFGNLVQTKDALQNVITLTYDLRGRKTQMVDPDTGTWLYEYDALGQLVKQRSPAQVAANQATTMAYDLLGRMISRAEPEYTSTWYYDLRADGTPCMAAVAGVTNPGKGRLCETNTSHGKNKKYWYDNLGRPLQARTTVTNGPSFGTAMSYDAKTGRLASQAYPTGLQVGYVYTARGYLTQVSALTALTLGGTTLAKDTALWKVGTVNAWGLAETETLANGVSRRAAYDGATGRVAALTAGAGTATNVLNHSYGWDSLNRLTSRADANGDGNTGAVSETFQYDSISRLVQYDVSAPAVPNLNRTVQLQYNAIGNVLYKSDVGNYSYPASGGTSTRPHAVSQVVGSSFGTVAYGYDANGNAQTASGQKWRSINYTSFNLPDSNNGMAGITGTPRYTWEYDENHQRIKEVRVNGSGSRTTWYQHPDNQGGLAFESEVQGSTTSNRHYISAGSQTLVLITSGALPTLGATAMVPPVLTSVTLAKLEYWHKDHLGSIASTTDLSGAVTARYAYDPYGKRRFTNGQYDAFGTLVVDWSNGSAGTDRGFTGHEHLDDLEVVHMNGRIYDPTIARFLQGDPFIQDEKTLGSFNRYAYCANGPLNCTDPTGYLSVFGHKILPGLFHNKTVQLVVAVVVAYYTGYWYDVYAAGAGASAVTIAGSTTITSAAISGFTYGAISGGSLKSGVQGAFSAALFAGVGDYLNNTGAFYDSTVKGARFSESSLMGVGLHAGAGCVSAVASGGDCDTGAMAAAFSQAALPLKGALSEAVGSPVVGGTLASMAIGGTASVIAGGKFADGAKTAAFGYLFNCARHVSCWKVPNDGEANFYRYGTPGNGEGSYAQARALSVMYDLDSRWGEIDSRRVGIGNVSLEDDSVFPPHASHRDGLQMDIRPLRVDGREAPVDWRSPQYDRAATQQLVDILRSNPDVVKVFFNDPQVKGVSPLQGHNDHLHVEVRRGP